MITMQRLTKSFWSYMTEHHKTNVVDKRNSDTMRVVAMLLDSIGVLDAEAFMERFGTTFGSDIYVPWKPGEGSDDECWMQIGTCVHEHVHVLQAREEGLLYFSGRYLLDASMRARYEAEAYRTNLELAFWRFGEIPSYYEPRALSRVLESYGCTEEQMQFMQRYLEISLKTILKGKLHSPVTRVAIDYLEAYAPHLRLSA